MNYPEPTGMQIRIETVKVRDLYAFACRFFENPAGQVIAPISKIRALAHSRNPCAGPDDIGLFVAYDGDKCVGYRGMLPGLFSVNGQLSKVSWASSIYVLPEYRKQRVTQELMNHWMSMGVDLTATGSTAAAMNLYRRSQFREGRPLPYLALKVENANIVAGVIRLCRQILKLSDNPTGFTAGWLEFFTSLTKKWYYAIVTRRARRALRGVTLKEVAEIRPLTGGESSSQSPRPHFPRDVAVINWMIRDLWFSVGGEPCRPPYYFTDVREFFRYIPLEIHDTRAGVVCGFVVLSVSETERRTVLKVLDWHVTEPASRATVFWIACRFAAEHQVDRVEFPMELSPWRNQLPWAGRTVVATDRQYYFHPARPDSPLAGALDTLECRFCDSDLAFY